MTLLTITPSIAEGLERWNKIAPDDRKGESKEGEPTLQEPLVGNPISHGQIIDLSKNLKGSDDKEWRLEGLLRGSQVYVPPPPPKAEPVRSPRIAFCKKSDEKSTNPVSQSNEYKVLMARLRHEEEERAYERMVNPPTPMRTTTQQLPNASSMSRAFAEVNRPTNKADLGDDDVTYNDVHRQMMLILNFVLSILGVAGALWVIARWWPTPARLFLTMGGSIAVGIAEFTLYNGYIWHLGQAKKKEAKLKEVKEVMHSWVVEAGADDKSDGTVEPAVVGSSKLEENGLRRRKGDTTQNGP